VLELENEIKKKTVTYGVAAMLLAVLLTAVAYNFGVQPFVEPELSQLKTFGSYEELESFLRTGMERAQGFYQEFAPIYRTVEVTNFDAAIKGSVEHSTTNIQVAGVDEADMVKTDGDYLYVVSASSIYILKAYPPEQAEVLSKITLNETYYPQIYVEGDKLAVLGNQQTLYYAYAETRGFAPYMYSPESFIKVYDITEKANPVLTRTVRLNGTFSGSRMIGNFVYLVASQPAAKFINETTLEVALPTISTDYAKREVQPNEIRYINVTDVSYSFTTVVAVNILNDIQEPTYETFLGSATSNMYVSQSNMYLAVPDTNVWVMRLEASEPREETLIYRVKLDEGRIVFEAQGDVLNQFSMDEYNGFFRIATTRGWGQVSTNNLYVLNMSLAVVGKLEGLAQGERIYSARFMEDRTYLVTFRQVDPFYVIDLADPTEPKVLGFLKIPGFSGYLHPYDEAHIIGIGKQDNRVKLSIFDVTNVTAPVEAVPSYVMQGDYSDSAVLTDHKAFLFDKSRELLALPISANWAQWTDITDYIKSFWQGEYVFNISLSNGFVLKGSVTHQENDTVEWDSSYWVKRAVCIDNVLYTVSDKKVKLNSLENLDLIKEIALI